MQHQYKKLSIWQKSVDFTACVYKATEAFPSNEQFGLISQLRRAAVSIPSNIAEGSKRSTKKDFRSFLVIALGSGAEVETQLTISRKLKYISEKEYNELSFQIDEIMRMISSFAKNLVLN